MKYTVVICTDTTSKAAIAEYVEQNHREKRKQRQKQRFWYFFKQRLAGILLLAITVPTVMVLDGDATMALVTVPLGLYLMLTKEMLIINRFYQDTEGHRQRE